MKKTEMLFVSALVAATCATGGTTVSLDGKWRLDYFPEPEVGLNILKLRPYEGYGWLYTKEFAAPACDAKEIGDVSWSGQGLLAIEYEQGGQKSSNWFLYGEPPFDYKKVRAWMK